MRPIAAESVTNATTLRACRNGCRPAGRPSPSGSWRSAVPSSARRAGRLVLLTGLRCGLGGLGGAPDAARVLAVEERAVLPGSGTGRRDERATRANPWPRSSGPARGSSASGRGRPSPRRGTRASSTTAGCARGRPRCPRGTPSSWVRLARPRGRRSRDASSRPAWARAPARWPSSVVSRWRCGCH